MVTLINEAVSSINRDKKQTPQVGIILGTGLGGLVKEIDIQHEIPYGEIPHFPESTVESHSGKLIFGKIHGVEVIAMQGRLHYYEGYSMQQIAFPVRVMKALGVQYLLISNAAGALNKNYQKGELMLIDDHINLFPSNPLIGPNDESLGPRFPDMSEPYNPVLNNLLLDVAGELGVTLHKGVYTAVMGPNLETRAEYRFLKTIGADVVGMSTIPEVIAANHSGLPCCAISVLTDECDPDNLAPVDITEIIEVAGKAEVHLTQLYTCLIEKLKLKLA